MSARANRDRSPGPPPASEHGAEAAGERGRSRGDERLLSELAAGSPVEQAAKAAGLSQRTVYRRLRDSGFQRRLRAARDELVTEALGELTGSAQDAVATLKRLLDASDDRVRLTAARTILEQLLRLRETVQLEQRLSALENQRERQGRRR